jgi:hypothetical protein
MVHMSSGGETLGSSRIPGRISAKQQLSDKEPRTGLVGAVGQVGVHTPWLRLGGCDGDAVLLGVVEQILPALEAVAELRQPPGRDNLDRGLECVEGELEADLVVALAGAAVRDEVAALLLGNSDLCAGDDWAGQRGAEQVAALVGGVALDGTEAELLDEFLLQVGDDHLLRADLQRLLLDLVPGLILTDVGEEAHDLVALL